MNRGQEFERQAQCRFCGHVTNQSSSHEADYPWLKDDNYAALVSIGALVSGWSLVCPIAHAYNLSQQYRIAEYWKFTNSVVDICASLYGEVRIFEHGACSADSLTSCGTAHAHLHVVPLQFSLITEATLLEPARLWQRCRVGDIARLARGREYLFVADSYAGEDTEGNVSILESGTSQFFRRAIANKLGCSEKYNYRDFPNHEISDSSAFELRRAANIRRRRCAA